MEPLQASLAALIVALSMTAGAADVPAPAAKAGKPAALADHAKFVVLVPFPLTDRSCAKKRPAVVVSSHGYNTNRRDIVIIAITSQVRTPLGFGETMFADWQGAGLIKGEHSASPP
jgi:hypothetical protein